jgi:hypothetical protein
MLEFSFHLKRSNLHPSLKSNVVAPVDSKDMSFMHVGQNEVIIKSIKDCFWQVVEFSNTVTHIFGWKITGDMLFIS